MEDAVNDDNSVVTFSLARMDELQVFRVDTVLLKGKKCKESVCIVVLDDTVSDERIRMTGWSGTTSGGGYTELSWCQVWQGSMFCLKPYFLDICHPIHNGDIFTVSGGMRAVECKVVETDPALAVLILEDARSSLLR